MNRNYSRRLAALEVLWPRPPATIPPKRMEKIAAWLASELGRPVEVVMVEAERLAREPGPPLPLPANASREEVIRSVAREFQVPIEEVERWARALDRL